MEKGKVGIFGGSGYVGSIIANQLKYRFDNEVFDVKKPSIDLSGVKFRQCDIRSPSRVDECCQGLDAIINTAIIQIPQISEQKRIGYEVNFIGTQNVCETVLKNPRIKARARV